MIDDSDSPAPPESAASEPKPSKDRKQRPFRRAMLRGLGVVMPPLLTIVLLLWIGNTIQNYALRPMETLITYSVAMTYEMPSNESIRRRRMTEGDLLTGDFDKRVYVRLKNGDWVRQFIYQEVSKNPGGDLHRGVDYYRRFVKIRYLKPQVVLPVFLSLFILTNYFLGKFIAAGVGRFIWGALERLIDQLPIIRNIYSSVKQVTDFVFSDSDVDFTRVVAVQYPRHGVWTVAFVTGESMLDIRSVANEPVLSVLVPTSPVPATGFSVTVLKSETVDLDITVDQAVQFMVSCGVVVPASQMYAENSYAAKIAAAVERASQGKQPSVLQGPGAEDGPDGGVENVAQNGSEDAKEKAQEEAPESGGDGPGEDDAK